MSPHGNNSAPTLRERQKTFFRPPLKVKGLYCNVAIDCFSADTNMISYILNVIARRDLASTSRTTYITTVTSVTLSLTITPRNTHSVLVSPNVGEGIYASAFVAKTAAQLRTLYKLANKSFFFGYYHLIIKSFDREGWVVGAVRRRHQSNTRLGLFFVTI